MALKYSAEKLQLLIPTAVRHTELKFRRDNISVRPSNLDHIVKAIYEDLEDVAASLGITQSFVSLTDTPANYTGGAYKITGVNAGETGVEYKNWLIDASTLYPGTDGGTIGKSGNSIGKIYLGASGNLDYQGDLTILTAGTQKAVFKATTGYLGLGTTTPLEPLHSVNGIVIGNSVQSSAGTIRYSGGDFYGHNGSAWVSFTAVPSNYFNKSVDTSDDITEGLTNLFMTTAERTKLSYITITQAVDLDQMEIDVAANTAKIGLADGDYGDITVSASTTVWSLDNDTVTNAKLANMATARFKGRTTAGTGDPEDLTTAQATALLDLFTSSLKGLVPASGGGTTSYLRADGTWAPITAAGLIDGSGTTFNVNKYDLGGTLTGDADIAGTSTYDIRLGTVASPIAVFDVNTVQGAHAYTSGGSGLTQTMNPGGFTSNISVGTASTNIYHDPGTVRLQATDTGYDTSLVGTDIGGFVLTATDSSSSTLLRVAKTASNHDVFEVEHAGGELFFGGVFGIGSGGSNLSHQTNFNVSSSTQWAHYDFGNNRGLTLTNWTTTGGLNQYATIENADGVLYILTQLGDNIIIRTGDNLRVENASGTGIFNINQSGEVTQGSWLATVIEEPYGGTGISTYATGDILYASGANTLSKLAAGSNGQVLTLAGGVPTWASAAGGTVGGSGTNHYVARWDPDGTTLADSVIQDDGTTASIGATPSGTIKWYVLSGLTASITSDNNGTGASATAYAGNVTGAATTNYGIDMNVYGATSENVGIRIGVGAAGAPTIVSGIDYGAYFRASSTTNINIGVQGEASGATSSNNVAGYFKAANGLNNYALVLEDGTETVGRFLKCVTASGGANWAAMAFSDITGTLDETAGGTGQTTYATGDILYASAANTLSKLAAGTNGHVLTLSGGVPVWQAVSGATVADADYGDITVSGSGTVWTIDNNTVSLAKMADVATGTVFYRKTAGTGDPEVQTLATLKTDLGLTGTNSGDQTITLTGDVTGSGTGSFAATIANNAVTNAKLDDMAQATIKGRASGAGTGDPTDLTAAQVRTIINVEDGAAADQEMCKTIVIESPADADFIPVFRTDVAITIVEAHGMLAAAGDVDVQLYWDTDWANTSPNAIGSSTTLTTTSEATINIATDPTIPANSWIFVDIGTVASAQTTAINIRYTED